jgi:hypothetical protein
MPDGRLSSLRGLRASVLLIALTAGGPSLRAQQASLALTLSSPLAYESVSGMVALGFSPYREGPSTHPLDLVDMLPADSDIPAMSHPMLDEMWRGSATFRRQWMRVAAARVQVVITLDKQAPIDETRARSEISQSAGLRVRISLRLVDREAIELLAHEIEHVLEQLDDVDLAQAVANHVHGASARGKSPVFETRRAIVVGRLVGAEVQAYRNRR